ncbi:MAG TPA: endonuclease VII domain-containing protein [Mycobacteriales bacterium]|nr:endonuclease VII domain-containing protein [Mycobacteriales bacterium]
MLPLTEFPRNRSRPDGHGIYCKLCYSIRYREHRERKASQEGRQIRELRRVEAGQKFCPRCQQTLLRQAFPRNRASADGLATYCRPCHNAISKANRERRGTTRDYHLRRRYGIGEADVADMLQKQGGVCAACRTDKPVHVDHDHNTGFVRGYLCYLCNQALGNVRDDPERLQGLIDYLERAAARQLELKVETYEPCACHVFEIAGAALHRAA